MARGQHYTKLSLSNALLLFFSGMCFVLLLFLSFCRFCFVLFSCTRWSFDRCSSDIFLSSRSRIGLATTYRKSAGERTDRSGLRHRCAIKKASLK